MSKLETNSKFERKEWPFALLRRIPPARLSSRPASFEFRSSNFLPVTFLWFLVYRLYCATSSFRYWTRRRFTAPGLGIVGASVVAALLAPDTENNVAYQAFTLLVCLLVVAFVF